MRRALALLAIAAGCQAEEVRGSFVFLPELGSTQQSLDHEPPILFLNRCADGCTIFPGANDSRTNHSTIVDEETYVSPFPHGDVKWKQTLRCVKKLYEPFEIQVTDQDPGDQPHIESIVAGFPHELGLSGIGGIAPFACAVVENGINFNFAAVIDHPIALCNVVGQESGHTLGLDHQMMCDDPMTYLPSCGEKVFRRADAECGEFEPRECYCGGRIQNSYLWLLDTLGPRRTPVDYAPIVDIVVPEEDAEVEPFFRIFADVEEDLSVQRVELFIDGALIGTATAAPYGFETPPDLALGEHELRVRAYDSTGQEDEDTIAVTLIEPAPRPDAGFFDAGPNPGRRPRSQPDAAVPAVAAPEPPSKGCGCIAMPDAAPWWLLLGLALLWRRR